jgi:hypothetical protein
MVYLGPLGPVDAETGRAIREYWFHGPGSEPLAADGGRLPPARQDPRRTGLRPGWLRDDGWEGHLAALADDDVRFLTESWELAGGKPPAFDTSWITHESPLREVPMWLWLGIVAVSLVALAAPILTLTGVLR